MIWSNLVQTEFWLDLILVFGINDNMDIWLRVTCLDLDVVEAFILVFKFLIPFVGFWDGFGGCSLSFEQFLIPLLAVFVVMVAVFNPI